MGTLNKIPKTGTFGTAVDAMNDNFTLIEQSLAEGYSPYQVWLDQGNEGTEQDFLDSLKGNPGTYIDPANTEIFDNISDLEGKTDEEKEAMVPNGKLANDMFFVGSGGSIFDISTSKSNNPSSTNYSVTFDSEANTVEVTTLKKIASSTVKGGFTLPNAVVGKRYIISFDYVNEIANAVLSCCAFESSSLSVGSGSFSAEFDYITTANFLVSLPLNTASGKSFTFSNIVIKEIVNIKDAVGGHDNSIETLEDDILSNPLEVPFSGMTLGNGVISPSYSTWNTTSGYTHYHFIRKPTMKKLSIQGNGTAPSYISFLKSYSYLGDPSGTPDYCDGYTAPFAFPYNAISTELINIPDDCNVIVVNKNSSSVVLPKALYTEQIVKSVVSTKTVATHLLPMEVGYIRHTGTNAGTNANESLDATSDNGYAFASANGDFMFWRTPGMVMVNGDEYTITSDKGDTIVVLLYNSERGLLSQTTNTVSTGEPLVVDTSGAKYLRLFIGLHDDGVNISLPKPIVSISGAFGKGLEIAKLGRQTVSTPADIIITPVWIEDAFCCSDKTTSLQDDGEWHIDFGVIRFPTNYDPDGEPVRLIIWCHGGTPRYNPVYSGDRDYIYTNGDFDSQGHLDPTLFLAEGYAVMDMDGVFAIFNEKEDENGVQPNSVLQTARCYRAGYDYVVRNYNIRTDGILLGGVSFGGHKSLEIIAHSGIPIIAAALESPYLSEPRFWYAWYRGMLGRSAGVSGLSNATTPGDEIEILEENYNKMLRVSPIFGACKVRKDEFFATTTIDGVDYMFNAENINKLYDWIEKVVYKWAGYFPVPIKIWCCTADDISIPSIHGEMLYAVGSNGGSDMELRIIQGGSHTPSTGGGSGQLNINNYVTKYGVTLQTVPLVYAEVVRFWRRYEQNQ